MRFFLLLLWCYAGALAAESMQLLMQSSPLAGSQYYAWGELKGRMQVGDTLLLTREPENRFDRFAIRVDWQGQKLGYVPRRENRQIAKAMDEGEKILARISKIKEDEAPWQRLEFEIYWVM